jgi:protein dithiol:quinone oxidoreductase
LSRGQRRWLNAVGFALCAALMGYALYTQYGPRHLDPCPLCIFQRVAMSTLGIVFAVAALHAPRGGGARFYAVLGGLVAATGLSISSWHVHVQNLPADQVPACGPGLDYMWDAFPFLDMLKMVFTGSGECHEINWSFLGASMPLWVGIWFAALGVWIVVVNSSRLAR